MRPLLPLICRVACVATSTAANACPAPAADLPPPAAAAAVTSRVGPGFSADMCRHNMVYRR